MLIGLIPTGQERGLGHYPYPREMLPAGRYFENGAVHIKPVAQNVLERMVLAGVERAIIGLTHYSTGVVDYFKDGRHLGLPLVYCWSDQNQVAAIDAAFDLVGDNHVAMLSAGTMHDPPSCIQQVVHQFNNTDVDLMIGVLGQNISIEHRGHRVSRVKQGVEESVLVWGPGFTKALRQQVVDGTCPQHVADAINAAIANGVKVESVTIANGQIVLPDALRHDPVFVKYRPLNLDRD